MTCSSLPFHLPVRETLQLQWLPSEREPSASLLFPTTLQWPPNGSTSAPKHNTGLTSFPLHREGKETILILETTLPRPPCSPDGTSVQVFRKNLSPAAFLPGQWHLRCRTRPDPSQPLSRRSRLSSRTLLTESGALAPTLAPEARPPWGDRRPAEGRDPAWSTA